jgi:multidrug efflux pump
VPSELAPAEDRGSFQMVMEGPEGAGFDYTVGADEAGRGDPGR